MKQTILTPPPFIMSSDRLLLHYAILNDTVGFNSGHGLLFVDRKEIGPVPCLAICQDRDSPQFMLYYCDTDWRPTGISTYGSVDAAKQGAERIYPGSIHCWVQAQFAETDAEHFRQGQFSSMRCSFCGKRPDETLAATFEGEGSARICGVCVQEFAKHLAEGPQSKERNR